LALLKPNDDESSNSDCSNLLLKRFTLQAEEILSKEKEKDKYKNDDDDDEEENEQDNEPIINDNGQEDCSLLSERDERYFRESILKCLYSVKNLSQSKDFTSKKCIILVATKLRYKLKIN
jgi:hypothetical protein